MLRKRLRFLIASECVLAHNFVQLSLHGVAFAFDLRKPFDHHHRVTQQRRHLYNASVGQIM
jgi:hypothetical protein